MTVAELISVLSEMDPGDVIVVEIIAGRHDSRFVPADDEVYKCFVDIDGAPTNAVALSIPA